MNNLVSSGGLSIQELGAVFVLVIYLVSIEIRMWLLNRSNKHLNEMISFVNDMSKKRGK